MRNKIKKWGAATWTIAAACGLLMVLATRALAQSPASVSSKRPNFLIVIADDATFCELPLFGGKNLKTPNVDRLAEQGMVFNRSYVSMAMCTPCRTELYTGLYPVRSGVCRNHGAAKPGTRSMPQHLGNLGYRTGLAGKVHVQPRPVFSFEMVEGFERNCVAETANHDCAGIREFMARDTNQPFCLVVALVVPHAPWTVGHPEHFDTKKLVLPEYMVDTPETRKSYARYLAEYEVMDQQLGDVLATLEQTGQADRTLVVFTSEQGGQWPGCKWTNWELGLHTALVARWPGHVQAGIRTDALVQYADILPTLMAAAGGAIPVGTFDGSSFLPVLEGRAQTHRQFVYAMHNNVPEGPPYPIRSVHDGRFHYIRNLTPDAVYIERHVMGATAHNPYWLSWVWKSSDDPQALALVQRYLRRPAEELYDTQSDPLEQTNLVKLPQHRRIQKRLSAELDHWLKEQKDPGAELDSLEVVRGQH